ncbi:WD40-repeat-containing domain protein, partial [Protomyces lactucae-debilis]
VAIGCNACTHAVSWSESGEIAYAAGQTVALYNPSRPFGVQRTLLGHTGQVTAVRWIDQDTVISGSTDNALRIWRRQTSQVDADWACQEVCTHDKSISCIVSCGSLVISSAMDGNICVFQFDAEKGLCEVQKLSYSPLIPLTMALAKLPNSNDYVLAVGGTTTKISLYTTSNGSAGGLQFTFKTKLAGHEDWIRSLDFLEDDRDLLLASGSQDRYVRIWRIGAAPSNSTDKETDELDALANLDLLQNKVFPFASSSKHSWEARFEALLVSHEDWVFSVQLSRTSDGTPCLLSASADSSVIVWQPDADADIWTVSAQLGIIATKGASTATGSTGGFWGAVFGGASASHPTLPDATQICAWNRTGALRLWKKHSFDDGGSARWQGVNAIGGHTKQVRSLSWSPGGEYLLTTSLDQTTRLWACNAETKAWQEFARPQIHGFDLQMIHALSADKFLSGAEEKLVRVFEASGSVLNLLNRVAKTDIVVGQEAAESANLPALGLSNKALGAQDRGTHLDRSALDASSTTDLDAEQQASLPVSKQALDDLTNAPLEDHLQRHTLFPESEKLYGHGYEIQALSATHNGRIIVSGCRATTPEHACLRFYDAETYRQLGQLYGHTLTVTQARFSANDTFLLSVSRDRSLILYKHAASSETGFDVVKTVKKAHKRIIWDCAWHPNSTLFATASRDSSVALWTVSESEEGVSVSQIQSLTLASAATAIAFSADGTLAVGCEDGSFHVY